jgi:maleylacetoacetate isomerase
MMKLYGYFRSSATFRARIALNLKGVEYDMAFVHLRRGEQFSDSFAKVNPQQLIPVLEDAGQLLTQSLAIAEYLDETIPEPPLLPADPLGRARVRALAQTIACEIHPLGNTRVLAHLTKEFGADEQTIQRWYQHWNGLGFDAFETALGNPATGQFCHGDRPGMADIFLVPQVFNARRFGLDLEPYPIIRRIFDACMALDAFDRAQPSKQPDAEA